MIAIELYRRMRRTAYAATLHSEVAGALMAFGRLHEASVGAGAGMGSAG